MTTTLGCLVLLCVFAHATCMVIFDLMEATPLTEGERDYLTILELLQKPRVPEKYTTGFRISPSNGFSWTSCGGPKDLVTISNISVKPDDLKLPGDVTLGLSGTINADIAAPIKVSVKMTKKIGPKFTPIPCIGMFGSCDYDDICVLFAKYCPAQMPCKCPFKAGPIVVPPTTKNVPFALQSGDFQIGVTAMQGSQQVLCLNMNLTID